jgi:HTH-type transcriptional regulator / antitoxin HipB
METIVVPTAGQVGPLLKILRKRRRLSQAELGAKLGLSQERISAIERHPDKVSVQTLFSVLMALQVEMQFSLRDSAAESVTHQPESW